MSQVKLSKDMQALPLSLITIAKSPFISVSPSSPFYGYHRTTGVLSAIHRGPGTDSAPMTIEGDNTRKRFLSWLSRRAAFHLLASMALAGLLLMVS